MKTISSEKLFETIQTEVRNIDYKIKVNSSLNRNDLAKLDAQKQILWTLTEKFESDAAEREEEKLQQLNDTILINKAIGLINLDFCIENDLDFAELAKAINRQRK